VMGAYGRNAPPRGTRTRHGLHRLPRAAVQPGQRSAPLSVVAVLAPAGIGSSGCLRCISSSDSCAVGAFCLPCVAHFRARPSSASARIRSRQPSPARRESRRCGRAVPRRPLASALGGVSWVLSALGCSSPRSRLLAAGTGFAHLLGRTSWCAVLTGRPFRLLPDSAASRDTWQLFPRRPPRRRSWSAMTGMAVGSFMSRSHPSLRLRRQGLPWHRLSPRRHLQVVRSRCGT